MNLPPLTADASLCRSMAHYRSSWPAGNTSGIAPSQVLAPGPLQPFLKLTNRQRCIAFVAAACTAGAVATAGECLAACAVTGPLVPECGAICFGLVELGLCLSGAQLCTALFGNK